MNFLQKIFRSRPPRGGKTIDQIADAAMSAAGGGFGGALLFGGGSGFTQDKSLTLSAVYRAVEIISDSIAQLPIDIYKIDKNGYKSKDTRHPAYKVLNNPNVRNTRYIFIKLMVSSMLLRGNGFAYILRDEQKRPKQIIYIPAEFVTVNPPMYLDQPPTYTVTGLNGEVPASDMIHILNYSYDGIVGVSTVRHAYNSLGLAADAENHAKGFFSGGCAIGGTLTVQSSLTDRQKRDIKSSWQQAFNPETGKPNSICILEGNMNYTPIGSTASDSQLLETRQFSVVEIARWFGVSPIKLFDLTKSSYSTVEATNLSFLSDTLAPIIEKYEEEFERKLFPDNERERYDVRFNTASLLRTDKQGQANYYQTLLRNGVMNVNEVRKELDLMPVEGGDLNMAQANMLSLKAIGENRPANSAITLPEEQDTPTDEQQGDQQSANIQLP